MSEILGNIYDWSLAIVKLYFLVVIGDRGNFLVVVFLTKNFSKSYICFLFIQKTAELVLKTSITQVAGLTKLPNNSLSNAFNLLLTDLWYTLSFKWPASGLKYLVLKGQSPKFKASVCNFTISERVSKCNPLFRHADSNWVTIMTKKR